MEFCIYNTRLQVSCRTLSGLWNKVNRGLATRLGWGQCQQETITRWQRQLGSSRFPNAVSWRYSTPERYTLTNHTSALTQSESQPRNQAHNRSAGHTAAYC